MKFFVIISYDLFSNKIVSWYFIQKNRLWPVVNPSQLMGGIVDGVCICNLKWKQNTTSASETENLKAPTNTRIDICKTLTRFNQWQWECPVHFVPDHQSKLSGNFLIQNDLYSLPMVWSIRVQHQCFNLSCSAGTHNKCCWLCICSGFHMACNKLGKHVRVHYK